MLKRNYFLYGLNNNKSIVTSINRIINPTYAKFILGANQTTRLAFRDLFINKKLNQLKLIQKRKLFSWFLAKINFNIKNLSYRVNKNSKRKSAVLINKNSNLIKIVNKRNLLKKNSSVLPKLRFKRNRNQKKKIVRKVNSKYKRRFFSKNRRYII